MRFLVRARRWAALTTICLTGLALPAAAGAADAPRLIATADAYTAPDGHVVLSCAATALTAASVGITTCYTTNGAWAPQVSLPGTTASSVSEASGSPGPYQVCIQAKATLIIGATTINTPLACGSSNALGVAHVETTA